MDHGPAMPVGEDHAIDDKKRLGLIMFIVYAVVYFGFIVINTVWPQLMGTTVLLGLNLAVFYGFILILLAIILGLIYNTMCNKMEGNKK